MLEELFTIPCILKTTGQTYFIKKVVTQDTPVGETLFFYLLPKGKSLDLDTNDVIRINKDSFMEYFVVE